MATNPAIEASIERDPDDDDAYLVYGDWLQTQNDPRGELVALQAAALRDPSDAKLGPRIDRFMKDHADELVVDLGKHVTQIWHLGFIRDVVFGIPKKGVADDLAGLRALIAHPSGRFVQSISIAQSLELDSAAFVRLLVDEKRPVTLAELRIGKDFDARELADVFPRLNRSIDDEWRRIVGIVDEQRKANLKFDAAALPRLAVKPGVELPGATPEQILVALRLELDKKRELGVVPAMKRSFTAESLDRFAVALAEQWSALGERTAPKWGFQTLGLLGDALAVAWIADRLERWSHQRAVQGAEMLGAIKSGVAVWEIYAMVSDPRMMDSRRRDAREILDRVATERGLSTDQLLDRSVPPTTIREGRFAEAIRRRLFDQAVDGRRIPHAEFQHYLVGHPLVAPFVRSMLWGTYERGALEATFRIDEDGKAFDAGGGEMDLQGATIGAVHPAEIPEDERKSTVKEWREVFDDEKIAPLFPLDRVVHELRDNEAGHSLVRYKLRNVGINQLQNTFENVLDWEVVREDCDGGPITVGWHRLFRRDNVDVLAVLDGASIDQVTATRSGKAVAFEKLHPVTLSEILWSLERATTREKAEAAAEAGPIERGARVRVTSGGGRGSEGVVFWIGDGNRGQRVGLRRDDDETVWADVDNVIVIPGLVTPDGERDGANDDGATTTAKTATKAKATKATKATKAEAGAEEAEADGAGDADEPKPSIAKGMKVRWKKSRNEGTGTAFWIGKNKFGDGMRVGVKDDETGDTVWADMDDCEPTA